MDQIIKSLALKDFMNLQKDEPTKGSLETVQISIWLSVICIYTICSVAETLHQCCWSVSLEHTSLVSLIQAQATTARHMRQFSL